MKEQKIIYYHDELNDEFSKAQITPKKIDGNYVYIHSSAWKKFTAFFWYRIVATPLAFFYLKHKFGHKVIGKEKIVKDKKGFFLYGNHTNPTPDALIPSFVAMPKKVYIIVHPNNVSMPILGKITPSMGALPLPDDFNATTNFMKAIKQRFDEGGCIMIYPEAHIWPYYTRIRPFQDISFRYPVQYGGAVYCFTNVYKKRKLRKTPRMITYIDGPFYPDETLPIRERKKDLRDRVYDAMVERSKQSDIEIIKYIKADE